MIKVSVIMSVYNGLPNLYESIESLQNQKFEHFEVIVVDDGSSDGSRDVLNKVQLEDPRFITYFNRDNIGLTKSLNIAIGLTQGEYIARMDDDDIALPLRLKKQSVFLDDNPSVGVVGSYAELIGDRVGIRKHDLHDEDLKCKTLFSCQFCHPSTMIRKSVLSKNNISYDEEYTTAQDYKLWVDLLGVTKFSTIPEVLLKYRVHSGQISSTKQEEQAANTQRIYNEIFSRLGFNCNESNLKFHKILASFSHIPLNVEQLKGVSDHIHSIIEGNSRSGLFPHKRLSCLLSEMFYNLLKTSNIGRREKVLLFFDNQHHRNFTTKHTKLKLYFS